MYQVYRVFLEFSHRVLAALVAIGSIALGVHAFRRGARQIALGLWSLLALQVMAGATTVWLRNVPVSVVLHLAVGMGFLAVLLVVPTRVFSPSARARRAAPGRGFEMVLALLVSQMLVGGVISSRGLGLACSRFPLCEGAPWPDTWTMPAAWQMLHRILGLALLLGSLFLWIRAAARAAPAAERRLSGELFAGTCAQVLLGGLNVWTLLAPAVSAAHLGLAVLLFALLVLRLEQGQTAGLPEAAPA
jgi:heme A synthase